MSIPSVQEHRLLVRAAKSRKTDAVIRLTRGRAHSYMARRINTRRKKDFRTMPTRELRLAALDLCDRNEQLENVLRKMLGTVQVGLVRGEFGADTLQTLYDMWKDAA